MFLWRETAQLRFIKSALEQGSGHYAALNALIGREHSRGLRKQPLEIRPTFGISPGRFKMNMPQSTLRNTFNK